MFNALCDVYGGPRAVGGRASPGDHCEEDTWGSGRSGDARGDSHPGRGEAPTVTSRGDRHPGTEARQIGLPITVSSGRSQGLRAKEDIFELALISSAPLLVH